MFGDFTCSIEIAVDEGGGHCQRPASIGEAFASSPICGKLLGGFEVDSQ